jgi:hypothetical protein
MVHYISDLIGQGLREIQADYPDWFVGIRQNGVVMGWSSRTRRAPSTSCATCTRTASGRSSPRWTRASCSSSPASVRPELCEELLDRTEVAIRKAWAEVRSSARAEKVRHGPRYSRGVVTGGGGWGAASSQMLERPAGRRAFATTTSLGADIARRCHAAERTRSATPSGRSRDRFRVEHK